MTQITAHKFPAEAFPHELVFRRIESDLIVHIIKVTGPGAFHIPKLGPGHYVQIIKDGKVIQDSRD